MDLALDDIIKQNKGNRGGARGRGRGGFGKTGSRQPVQRRGGAGGNQFRTSPSFPAARARNVPAGQWTHDCFDDEFEDGAVGFNNGGLRSSGRGGGAVNSTTKLMIANLDFGVSDGDINELFSEFGALRRATVHYDKSGRSLGTADVVFERKADALRAMKQYNGVPLDGRAMKIQIVGANESIVNGASVTTAFGSNRMRGGLNDRISNPRRRGTSGRGGGNNEANRPQRGSGGAGGRGRRGGSQKSPMTLEQLDADLDTYVKKME